MMREEYAKLSMILCFFFAFFYHSNGQIKHLEYQIFDIPDGLAQNTVDCIYQDNVGFLWFGTRYGLSRFDGVNFVNYFSNPDDFESLSAKSINDICEDKQGNLYFATDNGLSIYDRLKQKFRRVYRDTIEDITLPDNNIYSLKIDEKNRLWIGTRKGLILYDLKLQKFILPGSLFKNAAFVEKEFVNFILMDRNKVYIGTVYSGLYVLDKIKNKIDSYLIAKRDNFSYLNNTIYSLLIIDSNNLLIATGNGMAKLNLKTKEIKRYLVTSNLIESQNNIIFNSLIKTSKNEVLCGTSDFGIYRYDTVKDDFIPFNIRKNESGKLSGKSYLSMHEDRTGVLWLGTRTEGVLKVNLNKKPFKWIGNDFESESSIVDNNIFALLEDCDHNIWIGTLQGISIVDKENNLVKNLQPHINPSNTIKSNRIWALFEDSKKNIWIGSSDGVNVFRSRINSFDFISTDYTSDSQLPDNEVFAFNEDKEGNIWIGTRYGLSKYNESKEKYINYYYSEKDKNTIPSNTIWAIHVDSNNRIWVATDHGLAKYIPESDSFKRIELLNRFGTEWTGVNSISEDEDGVLWLGSDNGLVRLDPESLNIKNYPIFDKTGNHVVFSVKNYKEQVWFSAINGIARLNKKTEELVLFTDKDGIKSNEFNFPSILTKDKRLYFGGTNGITYFEPDKIEIDSFSPPIVFTGLKINFTEILPGKKYNNVIPIDVNINFAKNVYLNHDDNIFSISFASLDFKNKEKIEYAYYLEGLSDEWVNLGNENHVNFTGVKAGNYKLHVKATNSDGIWSSKIKSINIIVTPPWWQTKAFITFSAVAVFFLIVLIFKRREKSLKKAKELLEEKVHQRTLEISMQKEEIASQNEIIEKQYKELFEKNELIEKQNQKLFNKTLHLEEEIQQRHADLILAKDRAEESDRLKSAFISNLSHEVRTPLNAVIGFSELLSYQDMDENNRTKYLDIIKKSSNELLTLLDKLIDVSVIESKKVTISNSFFKLNGFLNGLVKFHKKSSVFKLKKLEIMAYCDVDDEKFLIYADKVRLEQVFNSLINNSIKYTETGFIQLGYYKKEGLIEFFVKDSGIGIPKEKMSMLFSRFGKFEQSKDKLYRGAGLSLSISKDLIELMGGKIHVESEINKGTTFYFSLPINPLAKSSSS